MKTKKEIIPDKYWPQLSYPLSLADALETLTKQQLTYIRINLDIGNLSSLNKQGLILKLAEKIPDNLWVTARLWDLERSKLVQKIAKNDGLWEKPLLGFQQYAYFRERGILFPGVVDGKRVVIMPDELVQLFKAGEFFKEQTLVARNTEWIKLTHGLLYGYGTLRTDELQRYVLSYADHKLAPLDMMNIFFDASVYYERFFIEQNGRLSDYRVVDSEQIVRERESRPELEFYPFKKHELLKMDDAEYVERNTPFLNLVRYVMENYDMDRDEAELLAGECADATKNGDSLASIIEMANDFIDMPDLETVAEVTNLLVPLMNHTRQWAIKGHAPMELSAKRASVGMALSAAPGQAAKAEVFDFQTKK
ncbi:hypothetical protein [Paenibacillus arenilitoris]|uniref:Uncharacterized protein n=1 Tax=Paenibacillus arenilitoris TaxID=2772299 RepID=A0A927HAM2_9BACL|nr:hypothetical protein [Paenibacillus arenilitoris]MBD2872749.1 hypothetical protein [Paenibacillus arenilitoris]